VSGYANYTYVAHQQSPPQMQSDPYAGPNQYYQPATMVDAKIAGKPQAQGTGGSGRAGQLNERLNRLDKGVNKWLKKLDQKI